MSDLFLSVLNLSLTASWLIVAVIILRFLFRKAPKWMICILWSFVAIRLLCPFSLKSALSLIPSSEPIPHDITIDRTPSVNSGVSVINNIVNPIIADKFTPDPIASVNPLQIIILILSAVWIMGTAVLMIYAAVSFFGLKKIVGASVAVEKNVLACDEVKSPFILGVIKPVIYIPSTMGGETFDYVIAHEKAHIRRGDHFWKPLGYLVLSVYWFNPLCWVAYVLLSRDIELACDERVVRDMDNAGKAAYSQALLNLSFRTRRIAVCPLAFGEVGVKERVKAVLNYRKPAFWIIIAAVVSCVAVCICFMTNPKDASVYVSDKGENAKIEENAEGQTNLTEECETLKAACREVLERCRWSDEDVREIVEYVNEYQGGDISKAVEMINGTSDDKVITVVHNLTGLYWPVCISDTLEDAINTVEGGVSSFGAGMYICERPGFGGDFSITINEDGTFQYYEGALSSYIGMGTWTYNDGRVILKDEGMMYTTRKYVFDYSDGALVFIKTESASFNYVKPDDRTRFLKVPGSQAHIFSVADGMPGLYTPHYVYNVAFANWSENGSIYAGALNSETMIISAVQHLPIYKFDSKADLDSFKNTFRDILTMDRGLDEMQSFDSVTASYDDDFFSNSSLLLAYVSAVSGSFRFGISEVYCDGKSFCMYVEQLNNPETYDDMMAGWFVVVEADKDDIAGCTVFDAQLGNPMK